MKKDKKFIIFILLMIVAVLYFSIAKDIKYKERTMLNSSGEITGTISKTQITSLKKKSSYLIYTKEHECMWRINSVDKKEPEFWDELQTGDTISFFIKEEMVEYMDEGVILDVVLLEKNGEILYGVEDYNEVEKIQVRNAKMLGVAIGGVFCVLALVIILKKEVRESDDGVVKF